MPFKAKHFFFSKGFYVVLFKCVRSNENKVAERVVIPFLEMCHFEWGKGISKSKNEFQIDANTSSSL